MSFAINPSLNHIDVPESCLNELYRSTTEVLLPDARFRGHPCEAYICIAKIEKSLKAYVALLETGMKTVFVYTSDYSATDPADYPQVYALAEAFVKKMGFVMEPVNLGFSPAMREVIIKGFQVMRPPQVKKQSPRLTKPVPPVEPVKVYHKPALPEGPPAVVVHGDLATELESLQRELASAKAAIAQIAREKVTLEQSATVEIASLKALCEQAMEAKRQAAEMFAAETEKLKLEEHARMSDRDEAELAALKTELHTVKTAGKTAVTRLQQEIASLQQQAVQLESDNQALEQRLAAADATHAEQVAQLAEEKTALFARIAANESAAMAAADKIAALALFESSWREGQQREEHLCSTIDLLKSRCETQEVELRHYKESARREEELRLRVDSLELELLKYHKIGNRDEELQQQLRSKEMELQQYKERESRAETLQLQVNRLEEELAAVRAAPAPADVLPVISAGDAGELQALLEEKLAIEAEYVRLANASREREQEMLDTITAAQMETARLAHELEIQVQVAALEQAALRAELRKMVVSGAGAVTGEPVGEGVAPQPVAAAVPGASRPSEALSPPAQSDGTALLPVIPPVQAAAKQSEPLTMLDAADAEPDRPIVADRTISSGLLNEFGNFSVSSGYASTEFSIDPALTAVTYCDPAEIEVLLYSSNTVQAVPDGSSIQRCKGYVIATHQNESYQIYVAWYLTESKKVVVCTPQKQPVDSEECIRTLQDAIAYFEIVGFMMELEELGESLHSYKRALGKVPVLCRTAKD